MELNAYFSILFVMKVFQFLKHLLEYDLIENPENEDKSKHLQREKANQLLTDVIHAWDLPKSVKIKKISVLDINLCPKSNLGHQTLDLIPIYWINMHNALQANVEQRMHFNAAEDENCVLPHCLVSLSYVHKYFH